MSSKGLEQDQVLERALTFRTYKELGGGLASLENIISELSNWPLDGILGFLSSLSTVMIQNESFFTPSIQGDYLKLAIVDDFPATLPGVSKLIVPGKLPDVGRDKVIIHEQNLAWLSHQAIIHSVDGQVSERLEYNLRVRTCRLLLMINDFLEEDIHKTSLENLVWRRDFVLSWLRNWQFNVYQSRKAPWIQLARQNIIMLRILPKFFNVEGAFLDAAQGISLQRYYEIIVQFLAHVYGEHFLGNRWINRQEFTSQLEAGADEINFMLSKWTRTPEEYRRRNTEWRNNRANKSDLLMFDFVPLMETPLIEARPDGIICPVVPFLLRKIVNGPFFILSDYLSGQDLINFHDGLARAYEEYANNLIKRIAKNDKKGSWFFKPNPRSNGEEIADAYLQRNALGVTFEHKGHRLPTDFLLGGGGERVLGPSDQILELLDAGQKVELQDGKKSDEGLITLPLWQQSLNANNLRAWAEANIGIISEKIYPLITHYADVKIDKTSRIVYLHPLIESAKLYTPIFLPLPQWLHISELESLAYLADNGELDLELLLLEKTEEYPTQRFDLFLREKFDKHLLDNKLLTIADQLLNSTVTTFWPGKQEGRDTDS